jgi:CRISPR-associated protein Cmr4
MALDPMHIGTGGYRLGRVDNTIVREPGTNMPKIPGTSLLGATRSYSAMRYGKPEAAGQHKNFKGDKSRCPIIYTFGTATEAGGGQAGKVSIGDAHILFFPVYSTAGPVWVSTKEAIECAGFGSIGVSDIDDMTVVTSLIWTKNTLNLGWILLKVKTELNIIPPDTVSSRAEWQMVSSRIAIVSPKLFSQIVNSNLEVRTSVAINPETGAAEDKALFTYEAIPRSTWFWFDVIDDDYDYSKKFPETDKQFKGGKENGGDALGESWGCPMDVAMAGLKLIEFLGIGGMSTRGFGRMKLVADWEVTSDES